VTHAVPGQLPRPGDVLPAVSLRNQLWLPHFVRGLSSSAQNEPTINLGRCTVWMQEFLPLVVAGHDKGTQVELSYERQPR